MNTILLIDKYSLNIVSFNSTDKFSMEIFIKNVGTKKG